MQWILQQPNSTIIFGAISNDKQGNQLEKLVNSDNVTTKYSLVPDHITGMCIALVNGTIRTLCANISAAKYYKLADLQSDLDNINLLKKSDLIYLEAFFLTNRLDTAHFLDRFCKEHNKILVFNLAGVYMAMHEPINFEYFAKRSHILIGNINEFESLSKLMNINSVDAMAVQLSESFNDYDTDNSLMRYGKIIVMTDEANPIKYVINNKLYMYKVDKIKDEVVVDTVSAGDAFAAGLLAALLKGFDIEKSLKWGCLAAAELIKQPGCTIPNIQSDTIFH